MTIPSAHLGRVHDGAARRRIVRSTMALVSASAAILIGSATGAHAGAEAPGPGAKSAWSYGFDDSSWTSNAYEHARTSSPFAGDRALRCVVNCGLAFGTYVVRRIELMSSNTADLSANKVVDSTGHAMAMSGMVVTERLEPDGFSPDPGFPADWVVVGERTFDGSGVHSWSLASSEFSQGLAVDFYRFEGSSFSMDFAAGAPPGAGAAPEASTWTMMLIGVAALGLARYRSARNERPSILILNRGRV